MLRTAAIAAVALAGATVEAYSLQKRDGGGGHGHEHAHAAAPSTGYDTPDTGYGAPPPQSYAPPPSSYSTPDTGYGPPSTGYGEVPSYEEEGAGFPDLTPIIIAVLALIGLSLLFPTFVTIDRKKRSLAEDANPMTDVVDRVSDIYNAVVTSEGCMERIACEVGGLAGDFGMTDFLPADKVASVFMNKSYKGMYKQFKSGKDCHMIKCLY